MTVRSKAVVFFRAAAITVFPFVFVHPELGGAALQRVVKHEKVHMRQQAPWSIAGLAISVLAAVLNATVLHIHLGWLTALYAVPPLSWFLLYLLALPVGWNPFRRRWEAQAMREADGLDEDEILRRLRRPPYYLWWI